jgi:hypothetical protein
VYKRKLEKAHTIDDGSLAWLQMLFGPAVVERPKRGTAVPHCDCDEALQAHGIAPHEGGTRANPMVPTKARGGYCGYCGHVAPMQAPVSHRGAPRKVRGICVKTGESVEFEHAGAARRAGYYNVHVAIHTGAVRCGRRWEYV